MSKYERMIFNNNIIYKGKYTLTSDFGHRNLNGDIRQHKGIDLVGHDSKDIYSPVDGVVVSSTIITDKSNPTWEWGNYIRIDSNGSKYFFCHLSKRLVFVGQNISKGQIIGVEGQTGYSFGSHLHFEIRNESNLSIDPKYVLLQDIENGDDEIVSEIKRYNNISEIPEFYQEYVRRWVDKGIIKGNSDGSLNLTEDMIRVLIITERMQKS